jgi:hypothetical protein
LDHAEFLQVWELALPSILCLSKIRLRTIYMLKRLLLLVVLSCIAAAAHAQVQIQASDAFGSGLVLSASGTTLSNGDVVRVGYIPSADLSLFSTSNNYSLLNSDFQAVGEGSLPTTTGTLSENGTPAGNSNTVYVNSFASVAGSFYGTFNGVNSSFLSVGSPLYLWVFNSSNPANATQWGVFSGSTWTFPAYPTPGSVDLSMASANSTPIRGTAITSGGNSGDFELAAIPASIPEPSSVSLMAGVLALGGLALGRRRPA